MKPYSDDHLIYDKSVHRYKLTELGVLQRLNRNLGNVLADNGGASDPRNEPSLVLDRVSRQIYGYIYGCTVTPKRMERDLALDPAYRAPLMEAMEEQLIYVLNSGDMTAHTGINLDTGMTVDRYRMRQSDIAPMALDLLKRVGLDNVAITEWRDIKPDYEGEEY